MASTAVTPDLLEAGISSYIEAMIALREFRRDIQRTAREVIERRMPELMDSIGFKRYQVSLEGYANPDSLEKGWDGSFAWVAVRLRHSSFHGYFGWLWREHGEQLQAGVVATFAPTEHPPLRKELRSAVRMNCIQNVCETYGTEISLWEPLSMNDVKSFGERLDKLINDWIRVWKSVGGLKGLTESGSCGPEQPCDAGSR
jgi:hypothetical protein